MDSFLQAHDRTFRNFDRSLHGAAPFNQLHGWTGLPRPYIALLAAAALLLLLFLDVCSALISNLAGFVYPAYASIRAIESPAANDDTQWLTYWVVFALLSTLEFFGSLIVYFVPMYHLFKVFFLVWLYLPTTRGAEHVYAMVLRPLLVAPHHRHRQPALFARPHAPPPPPTPPIPAPSMAFGGGPFDSLREQARMAGYSVRYADHGHTHY
ncbi:hypothetical protein GQ42DRAFT_165943 [Ramicandelaber brevisporus]|nr:hypothetical protein GQ42DRAFT_165943 [Ramicandelaber brevisporus]